MRIPVDSNKIADFCRRHQIRKLAFFGSVLRDDFSPESDVDVLVEFAPGKTLGFEILEMEEELSRLLSGRKVDLVNARYLNPRLRPYILGGAQVQYAEG